MHWNLWDDAYKGTLSSSSAAWKGCFFTPNAPKTVTQIATLVQVYITTDFQAAIGTVDASNVITQIHKTPKIRSTRTGLVPFFFPLGVPLEPGKEHFLAVGITDQLDTHPTPLPFSSAPHWLWDCTPGTGLTIPRREPEIGHAVTRLTMNVNPPFGLKFAPA